MISPARTTKYQSTVSPLPFAGFLRHALRACLLAGALCSHAAEDRASSNAPAPLEFQFKPNLPVVMLQAKGEMNHDQRIACALRLIEPARTPPSASKAWPGVVKIHGGVSQGYPKKSYGLTLAAPA